MIGALILLQAIMTRFEVGLIKVIPMRMHLMMDYVIGFILAASPWLFGFSDQRANAWMPHLIVAQFLARPWLHGRTRALVPISATQGRAARLSVESTAS